MTRQELENKMAVLLGGRAAEHIIFGELSTGASDDLVKVSDIARSIVTRYGMTEELGLVVYEKSPHSFLGGEQQSMTYQERAYSEHTASEIDAAVKAIVDTAFRRTVGLLRARRDTLERGAHLLLEHETLDEADLIALQKEPAPVTE
jgi:cell division protease FtsH